MNHAVLILGLITLLAGSGCDRPEPAATETPVTDGERVYALFGNVGVFAFTLEDAEVWSQRLEPRPTRYGWGTAASPVLHGGRLFIVNDNEERAELFALDAATRRELWRVDRDEKSNWATPALANDRLLIRTAARSYCLQHVRKTPSP